MDKDQERWYLERFRSAYPEFPKGQVIPHEEPDFLATEETRQVGIELTQLLVAASPGEQPRRATESLRERVRLQAWNLYKGLGGPPVIVAIHFSDWERLTKEWVRSLAEELAQLVAGMQLGEGQAVVLRYGEQFGQRVPREVALLSVCRFSSLERSEWIVPDAGYEHQCTPEEIQDAIDRKAKHLAVYRSRCDEAWLVLVVDGFGISSMMELPEAKRQHVFTSPFDRNVYFDNFSRTCIDLVARP